MRHENDISKEVLDCCIKLHTGLGPGVFENVYERLLVRELAKRGIGSKRQLLCPIVYEGIVFEKACKIDVLVEDIVIFELKSIEDLHKRHFKQVRTYLKLSKRRLGLLINFGEERLSEGFHRIVNGLGPDLPDIGSMPVLREVRPEDLPRLLKAEDSMETEPDD